MNSTSVSTFLPNDFKADKWEAIKPYYEELKNRKITSKEELRKWFLDRSELESALQEELAWRYIRMTCDTQEKQYTESFNDFVANIQPNIAPYSNALDEKALRSVFLKELREPGYPIAIRNIEKEFKIFREKNVPILSQIEQEAHKYGAISGAMTVEILGKELTIQQASDYLQSYDRSLREKAYIKISERQYKDKDKLDDLYSKLIHLRNKVALNADFKNYRDYMFTALGRFDYTPQDCFDFHEAVRKKVLPLINELASERKNTLKLDELKPWDLQVNYHGKQPLKPFNNADELLQKTITCFRSIDPYLAECLSVMKQKGHLDLESRKGKAPGGYNYPLDKTGIPFIFMNATSTLRDVVTLVHEGGHALHAFLTKDLELNVFKHPPAEVAELASMSMELISMEHWDVYFKDKKELARAKREHLEGVIKTLPWVATIDKFQHWVYENPTHSIEERKRKWLEIFSEFSSPLIDWKGCEKYRYYTWQKQLHLFEVPFYYIEYGIAQLGAIAIWKNYKSNPKKAFSDYLDALKLGYTATVKDIYKTANISFDFSPEYIGELISFVIQEMKTN
ncbi:MAG: M3 family oligoendopeptidase [Cytophagaceae bacterium]|nr:M3 family oligoendopeptidase [Cytophagaceae bacterium]MDW8456068.1 M3 family oligoendopeptidase [Cytophagaceae bacterium]